MTNLNKAEIEALKDSDFATGSFSSLRAKVGKLLSAGMSASKIVEKLSGTSARNPHKKETIRDVLRDLKANNPQKKLNRGTVSGMPHKGSGDMDGPFWNQKNKGGIVKRYKGGLMVKPKAAKRGY